MCTVLQQHLARMSNGYEGGPEGGPEGGYARQASPIRLAPQPTYSYLGAAQDSSMRRPVEPYDRKVSAPAMHFHVPPNNPDGTRPSSRARSAYSQQLLGRSRSHSRTGMRVLVAELKASTPRPKSPHMNNEEPISFSHYPDGRPPSDEVDEGKPATPDAQKKRRRKKRPIERDDFPAPPFPYIRRRHWSEPMLASSSDEEEAVAVESSSSEDDNEVEPDPKLDQTETELKKISTGMASVFLTELAVERERRRHARNAKYVDPRSAARTPAANREPPFRLRYDSPVNASPSRVADHLRPWEMDDVDGHASSRSFFSATPFLPSTPGLTGSRLAHSPKASTLPARFSPGAHVGVAHSTDLSTTDMSDDAKLATPPENGCSLVATEDEDDMEFVVLDQAPNVYPVHLLVTTNYRLPGDVDRCNLERHLTDNDFEALFRCARDEFYRMPYWKRSDMKRRHLLF